MYAIVQIGGKQYKIEKDMMLHVDKLRNQREGSITIDKVLMYVEGDQVLLGQPYLDNVKVTADVLGVVKGRKVRGIKFKKRKNYTRTLGHRPEYLRLKINEVSAGSE
ncbi:MAG: 50S ribosomal protein L21 [Spirochaetota bacterium]|nr:50S ribosomal protein L21 [Spirochaetota bacterium]